MPLKSAFVLPPLAKRLGYDAWNAGVGMLGRDEILVWPPVQTQDQMDDTMGRLRHYFAAGERVAVPRADRTIRPRRAVPHYMGAAPVCAQFRFPVVRHTGASPLTLAMRHRGLLLRAPSAWPSHDRLAQYLPNVAPFGPDMVKHEGCWVTKLQYGATQRARVEASRKAFLRWKGSLPRRRRAYILCTGPSLAQFRNFDFSDGYVIGCNTVVKNEELMAHTNPVLITALDANFFFGPSIYAARFRADLAAAMARHPFRFLTADYFHQVIHNHLREFADRTFFVPTDHHGVVSKLDHEWEVTRNGNILTGMMLPLAWTLADEIHIIGADGRAPDETYFWQHDPSSQLTDKLQAMKDCHPRFFHDTNYEDYYAEHCEILEGQIAYIERNGGKVASMTPSHIPALARRPVPG